ncbi:MAG: FAD-binding protein, partial [bacterium]
EKRDYYFHSAVKWMDLFLSKLDKEVRTDMFSKTPYEVQNQMTKMGVATDHTCRSDIPGLLAAGLAQAGCANHFAGFHIGMCVGTGWIAGISAVQDLETLPEPVLDSAEIRALYVAGRKPLQPTAKAESDRLLQRLQTLMFRYDVSVWKHEERLKDGLEQLREVREEFEKLLAPDIHELVRLKETEAMVLAAEIILRASLFRTETRMSHFREDFKNRDDDDWLCWVDVRKENGGPRLSKKPIPTPIPPETGAADYKRSQNSK